MALGNNVKAQAVSPLSGAIASILDNPQYLNGEQARELMMILKRQFPDMLKQEEEGNVFTLESQLKKMGETLNTLGAKVIGGESTDVKRFVDAQMQFFRLFAKYSDTIQANKRMSAIEAATIASLQELDNPTLQKRFLVLLEKHLQDHSHE